MTDHVPTGSATSISVPAARQRWIADLWDHVLVIGDLWHEVKGDPPDDIPGDTPALRRWLWPALRGTACLPYFEELLRLLEEDQADQAGGAHPGSTA